MASADFLRFVVTMLRFEFVYSYAPARPPRVSVITFTSYICCIYALNFGQYRTLFCLANSSISKRLFFMQFLFVRPRFCLRLLSDSASRRTPLSLANSSYCHACSGLSPPSYYACRAHKQKQGLPKSAFDLESPCFMPFSAALTPEKAFPIVSKSAGTLTLPGKEEKRSK